MKTFGIIMDPIDSINPKKDSTFALISALQNKCIIEYIYPENIGNFSINFSITYALIFSLISILSSYFWLNYYKKGPLEWIMRKLTD